MHKNLWLNGDKSKVIKFETVNQLRSAEDVNSVSVAGAVIPVALEIESLDVILDERLMFNEGLQLPHECDSPYSNTFDVVNCAYLSLL